MAPIQTLTFGVCIVEYTATPRSAFYVWIECLVGLSKYYGNGETIRHSKVQAVRPRQAIAIHKGGLNNLQAVNCRHSVGIDYSNGPMIIALQWEPYNELDTHIKLIHI